MNRFLILLIFIITTSLTSCNNSSGGSSDKGYVDPDLDNSKTLVSKSYELGSVSCPTGSTPTTDDYKACGAIIFKGKLKEVNYVGFATGKDSANPNFNVKIYWEAASITSVDLQHSSFTIIINDGTYEYNSTTDNLNVEISGNSDSTIYTITFSEEITVSDDAGHTFTINTGDSITAYKAD